MRIGLHVNDSPGHDRALDYCRRVKPAAMKWLSPDAALLRECRAASPSTKHIGRVVVTHRQVEDYGQVQNATLDRAREFHGLIDYWEGANEAIGDTAHPDRIREFARLEVGLAKRLNEMGVGALIGGFSTGTLDDGKLDAFAGAFDYMNAVGPAKCALHFHEYAAAYVSYQVKTADGRNQWPDGGSFTGPSTDPAVWWNPQLRGWLTLRYRDLLPLIRTRWPNARGFITESGIDNTNKDPRSNGKGWKDSRGTPWETINGLGDYAGQMKWYAWQLSHDPSFILGCVDFGFGATDPDWASFDLSNELAMLERFIAGQLELPVGAIGAVPAPSPGVPPMPTLNDALRAEFGDSYDDLRTSLPSNPSGPNGPFTSRQLSGVRYIAVHHTAGPKTQTWEAIARYHVDTKHWAGIGYHIGVRGGRVSHLGDIGFSRANVANLNHLVIGVCLTGDYTREELEPRDRDALKRVVKVLDAFLGRKLDIGGHGQLPGQATACPGTALLGVLPTLRTGTAPPPTVPTELSTLLRDAAAASQKIRLNAEAGIQKKIAADGFWPTGNEAELTHGGGRYIFQRAQHPTTGKVRVYYVLAPQWADVKVING